MYEILTNFRRGSIRLEAEDGFEDGVGLGEDYVFQDGLVGDEGVHGADAADGGVEEIE